MPRTSCKGLLAWTVILAGGLMTAPQGAQAAPQTPSTWITPFVASRPGSGEPLYRGESVLQVREHLLHQSQEFRTLDGRLAFRMESVFDLTQERPLRYESEDAGTGERVHVTVAHDSIAFKVQDAQGRVLSTGTEAGPPGIYLWPNLEHVVSRNWLALSAGQDLDVDLHVASRTTRLRVRMLANQVGEATVAPTQRIQVEAGALLVRAFMKPVQLVFSDQAPHRLLIYEGRGPVSGPDGKSQDLRIVFGSPRLG